MPTFPLRCGSIQAIVFVVLSASFAFSQQETPTRTGREASAIEILNRAMESAGGRQALLSLHDITENGEITFWGGRPVKGPVAIRSIGGSRFRMDADLSQGKRKWVVKEGIGSDTEGEKTFSMPHWRAINLHNLTFPLGFVTATVQDATTDVALVGIETLEGRSVYRVRVSGRLGLSSRAGPFDDVVKELLIDAHVFEIVRVEDYPLTDHARRNLQPGKPQRQIDFGDFRVVSGVRVPFSISIRDLHEKSMTIQLSTVAFNSNLTDVDFGL